MKTLSANDLQQLLTETKKLSSMNRNLRIMIENTHKLSIDEEALCILLENNYNFLKYFHDCLYTAAERRDNNGT